MDYDIVNEIMTDDSETETKYLQDSINNVTEKVDLLKLNVKEKMEQKYVQFIPFVLENEVIVQNTNELVEDIIALQERLDTQVKKDVEGFTEELTKLHEELIESSTIVDNTSMLSKINYHLEEANKKNRPYDTAKHINFACKYLNEECKVLEFLDIYKSLTKTVTYYKVEYCKEAINEWNKHIQWIHVEENLKSNKSHTSLSVSTDKSNLENLLKTLEMYEVSDRQLASFGDNFMKHFLTLIIKFDCSLSHKHTRMSAEELIIYSSHDTQTYLKVLENLRIAFQFLNNVLGVQMHETSFLSNLGEYIADDFLSLLIDECLTNIVPLKKEELEGYETIIDPIINFQTFLQDIGFIPKTNTLLKDYFGKVDKLFIKKAMEKYAGRAQQLMKRDLHELLQVGDIETSKTEQSEESIDYENVSIEINKLSPDLFVFPRCCVSKSIQELISLIHEILNEGLNSDADLCVKFFFMTRTIIGLYSEAVPMYNAKLLYDIPQYSALLHNNLLYLAHQILIMNFDKKFYADSPEAEKLPINCFADLIPSLRKGAVKVLSEQITRQEKIFIKMIRESGLSALSEYEELPESTEKSIKACLRQLGLLKAVWENVLPIKIYTDAIGGLCNIIIEEITSRIVATSDIRANIATSLVKVLSHIEVEVPLLFPDSSNVILHLENWSKLKELILVLGASLAEVGERWADGKGPLASEFSADQVKQMIKALFQMSERRAAVLSRIK